MTYSKKCYVIISKFFVAKIFFPVSKTFTLFHDSVCGRKKYFLGKRALSRSAFRIIEGLVISSMEESNVNNNNSILCKDVLLRRCLICINTSLHGPDIHVLTIEV